MDESALRRDKLQKVASAAIEKNASELIALSRRIWANPELGYQEFFAHDQLTEFLDATKQFEVERQHAGIKTSFRAQHKQFRSLVEDDDSTGEPAAKRAVAGCQPHVAFLCEYDALPEIGHACGHNLIAEAGKFQRNLH